MNMERTRKILPPSMPNFFFYEEPSRPRQDGYNQKPSYPITDFSREEAEQYGELMKQEFIKHWEEKVSRKVNQS